MLMTMADMRWQERVTLFLALTLFTYSNGAPQHHPPGNHFRMTISAEDNGEVSHESLQRHSRQTASGHFEGPMQMTKSWMSFGDSDSSHVGKPISGQYFMQTESHETEGQIHGSNEHFSSFTRSFSQESDHGSVEYSSNEHFDDDDDMNILRSGFGRRYHPIGAPLAKSLNSLTYTPQTQYSAQQIGPQISLPNFIDLDSDEDIQEEIEDHIEDIVESIPMSTMYNLETGKMRSVISEDVLNSRYNFIDTQGSVNWGFTLEDQFQKQIVHRDGSMEGEYGWETPEGGKVHIKYTAGKNGVRVTSSIGQYQEYDDDVKFHREQHFNAHKNTGFHMQVSSEVDDNNFLVTNAPNSNVGVPMPNPGGFAPNFNNNPANNPNFGVPMPSPGRDIDSQQPGLNSFGNPGTNPNFGVPMPQPGSGDTNFGAPNQGGNDFGAPNQGGNDFGAPNLGGNDFGVPNVGGGDFGVPMPQPDGNTPNFGASFPPNPNSASGFPQDFGVPMPNPNNAGSQNPSPIGPNLNDFPLGLGGESGLPPNFGGDQPNLNSGIPASSFPSDNNDTPNFGNLPGAPSPNFNLGVEIPNLQGGGFPNDPSGGIPNPSVGNPTQNAGTGFALVPENEFDDLNKELFGGEAPPLVSNIDNLFNSPNGDSSTVISGIDNLFSVGASSDGQNSLLSGPPSNLPPQNEGAFPLVR